MPAPSTADELLTLVAKSELLPAGRLDEYLAGEWAGRPRPQSATKMALALIHDGLLTKYQAEQLLAGRWRNFLVAGKYRLLERIGKGGMAMVFLCEHLVMKRPVALKILPIAHGQDKELLGRFHREARALSALRHPNIVGAYDADRADALHFLVMEYVDGGDLEQVVLKVGPLGWERSADYIRQAALGLQHAHECGLVHRDVKPGNLLLERSGAIKLLDLGLARIFHERADTLTTGRDAQTLLGTIDYLAPEQAINSHDVDIRADIYGLGATFYFLLTGKGLFEDGTVAQKLTWHVHRPPVPLAGLRPDVPEGLARVVERMLAKSPADRHQTPDEVVQALDPWTQSPVPPPDPREFVELSRAARALAKSSSHRWIVPRAKSPVPGPSPIAPQPPSDAATRLTEVIREDRPTPAGTDPAVPVPVSTLVDIPMLPVAGPPPLPQRRRGWRRLVVVGTTAAVLLAGAVAGRGFFEADPTVADRPGVAAGRTPARPADSSRPAVVEADARFTLVSGTEPGRAFDSLREAVRAAMPGDRVTVVGSLVLEAIELSDIEGVVRDLTIEGVVPGAPGRAVRWRSPRGLDAGRPMLDVTGLEGFRLKNFAFDGEGRVACLVRLTGRAGGSSLEDLAFEGATRADVVLRGWAGDASQTATIRKARFAAATPTEEAIRIEPDAASSGSPPGSIRIVSCRFVGPYQAALLVAGPVDGLEVEQCRFSRAVDGLRYQPGEATDPFRVRLANNTFADLQRAIHYDTTPRGDSSELVVVNNLFANTTRGATLDRVPVEPGKVAARWIWAEEGRTSATVPPGTRFFRKGFDLAIVPAAAKLDISCDDTSIAWLNGIELRKDPSPHYTQRVDSIEVAAHLRPGRNVLAVQGTHRPDRLDAKSASTAGLLALITTAVAGKDVVLVKTDETWKCSDRAAEGWTRAEFEDRSWTSAHPWKDEQAIWPWKYAVWDSVVKARLKPPLRPIRVVASGNLRDHRSWEGYPTLDSERVLIEAGVLPRAADDDATFLRYPPKHPLATAGPGGAPVGASEE